MAADEAKELAKAFQEFGYLSQLPEGFTDHPGDALAYQCWKLARQKKNLPERTRLIVKGLKFAHSPTPARRSKNY
ncbi:RuBisCO accumulation factor 1 [Synechocystis salina]|uniref:RuBisCO accumulation factor 1 n=1 Tax=Synechocystis salina TaxID=945780 RepID=UPI00223FCC4D|nr:RuBisCO accumulation factor 1 [Synechocystis salina]